VGDAILDIVNPPLRPGGGGDRQSRVERFSYVPGGNATNFALAFAALGGRSALVASLGKDWAGDVLRAAYRAGHVDAHVRRSGTHGTGTTVAVTFSDGTRHLITAPGANADLRLAHVPSGWIAGTRHLHRAGYWWASGLLGGPTVRLLARAKGAGATTSLDISTDPEGWPLARRRLVLPALPHCDVFFGNEEEVTRLAGRPSVEEAARVLLRKGVREVVLHQGRRGSSLFTASGATRAPGFRAASVNPTGCGDVFNAAYVRASIAGLAPRARLGFANAAGAWHLEAPSRPYPRLRDLKSRFGVVLGVG
jgi:2-dehydro-3-deoxygluconokinase